MKVEVNNDRKGGEAMKFASKYISPIFITLFWFLLGGAFILFFDLAVGLVYESLSIWNHDLFPTPSPISEVEAYRALQSALTIVTIIFTVITSTSFAKRFDNKRFEYLIVQTEGFYTVPERTVLYFKEFWLSDVIASSISPILLILPVYLVPEEYLGAFYRILVRSEDAAVLRTFRGSDLRYTHIDTVEVHPHPPDAYRMARKLADGIDRIGGSYEVFGVYHFHHSCCGINQIRYMVLQQNRALDTYLLAEKRM